MHPYYYPTTVVILDDDELFLESLIFHFGDEFICRPHGRPETALEHIRAKRPQGLVWERFFSMHQDTLDLPSMRVGDSIIAFQPTKIQDLLKHRARFDEVSVAVVDYDMPSMDGVEFCRRLKSLPVKTIMLTGKADQQTAIEAFNEGLLDCFIVKQDNEAISKLGHEIRRMQQAFFRQITKPMWLALALQEKASPVTDRGFADRFAELCEELGVVEYYVSTWPPGALLVDVEGEVKFLLVYGEDDFKTQHEVASAHGAPAELLAVLAQRSGLPLFPGDSGFYEADLVGADWQQCLQPCQRLETESVWYYAVAGSAPLMAQQSGAVVSYRAYREDLSSAGNPA